MFLFSGLLRRWLLITVGLPLAAAGAKWAGRRLERRRGRPTALSRALQRAGARLAPRTDPHRTGHRPTFHM